MPMTVGGRIRTIEDIRDYLSLGADKVAINTAIIKNPKLVTEVARKFGEAGYERVKKEFSSEKMIGDYLNWYGKIF